jgi:predicted N-acyltransferase
VNRSHAAVAELRVEYTTSLQRLHEAGWDRLAGGGDLYATTAWLRFVEDAMQGAPTYLLGWDRDRLASGLACYWFPPDATFAPMARVDRMLRRAHLAPGLSRGERRRRGRAVAALLPTLCCGSRQLSYSRLLLEPGLNAHGARAAAGEMLAAAELLARELGAASLSFNCVDAHDEPLRGELRARGFAEFFSQRRCVLEVDDLYCYRGRFRAHRRTVIRRELRALDEAGVRFDLCGLADLPVELLAPLEHNLLRRYGVRRGLAQVEASLREARARFGRDGIGIIATRDGAISAFAVLLRWHDHLCVRHVGFDYDRQADLPLYFGTIFYVPAQFASALGVRVVDYGTGSIETKASRGCRVIDQYGYVRCADEATQRDIEALIGEWGAA